MKHSPMNSQNKRGLFCHSSCNFLNPIFTLEIPIPLTLPFPLFSNGKKLPKIEAQIQAVQAHEALFLHIVPAVGKLRWSRLDKHSSNTELGTWSFLPLVCPSPSTRLLPVDFQDVFFLLAVGEGGVKKLLEVNQAKVILIQNPTTTPSEDCEILDYVRFFQNLRRKQNMGEFTYQPHDHLNLFSFKCRSSQH